MQASWGWVPRLFVCPDDKGWHDEEGFVLQMWKVRPQSKWMQDQRRDECSQWNAGCASWRPGTSAVLDEQLNPPKDPRRGCLCKRVCWRFTHPVNDWKRPRDMPVTVTKEDKIGMTVDLMKLLVCPRNWHHTGSLACGKPLFANTTICLACVHPLLLRGCKEAPDLRNIPCKLLQFSFASVPFSLQFH